MNVFANIEYRALVESIAQKNDCSYEQGERLRKLRGRLVESDIDWLMLMDTVWARKEIGNCYLNGNFVRQDYQKAFECYKELENYNNPVVMYCLALCYDEGWGTLIDHQLAMKLYKKSSDMGNVKSTYALGYNYEFGKGCSQNIPAALDMYKIAVKAGCHDALYRLFRMHFEGDHVERNEKIAIQYLLDAIEADKITGPVDDEYLAEAALYYMYGIGVTVDTHRADELIYQLQDKTKLKSGKIIYLVALYYYDIDRERSMKFMMQSADDGYNLAIHYLHELDEYNKEKSKVDNLNS